MKLYTAQLNESINSMVEKIFSNIEDLIKNAKVDSSYVSTIFLTGGSTSIRLIKEKIVKKFTTAKIVQGDIFGSVGLGLSLEAKRKFS